MTDLNKHRIPTMFELDAEREQQRKSDARFKLMKRILYITSAVLLVSFGIYKIATQPPLPLYCGKVVSTFKTEAGYRVEPQAYVVFYCDSLKRNVAVNTTWNTYVNCKVGQDVCFRLHWTQLEK